MIDYLIAHFIGDFYLQTEGLSAYKKHSLKGVLIHCALYSVSFISVFILRSVLTSVNAYEILMVLLVIGIHALIDILKWTYIDRKTKHDLMEPDRVEVLAEAWMMRPFKTLIVQIEDLEKSDGKYALSNNQQSMIFIVDQILHFLTIFFVFKNTAINPSMFNVFGLIILSMIVLMKPSNILIQNLIQPFDPKAVEIEGENQADGFLGAGERIGTLERLLMFIILFVSQGSFAGIAVVLTLKTIARYEKISKDGKFAEYFVIGSLTSLLIVTIIYVGIFQMMILNP